VILECLLLSASLCPPEDPHVRAQEPSGRTYTLEASLEAKKGFEPLYEPPKRKKGLLSPPRFSREVLLGSLVLGAAQLSDGASTRSAQAGCARCYESDPLARALLGRQPTWPRMLLWGSAENIGASLLAERMRRSKHAYVRRTWFLPQFALAGYHAWATFHNSRQ